MLKVKVIEILVICWLLIEDVIKFDVGIDWENVNFDDVVVLEKVLKFLLVLLLK